VRTQLIRRLVTVGAALALTVFQVLPAAAAVTTVVPTTLTAPNGLPGGIVGQDQGADQGEDQGENIAELGIGPGTLGPTAVHAANSMTSGDANGGAGGDVLITVYNYVTTHCLTGITTVGYPTEAITARAGTGGAGGRSGSGQGTDQGEDQGENIGQFASGGGIGPTTVTASNTIVSGLARGGNGGSVRMTINHYTKCVAPGTAFSAPLPSATVSHSASGTILARYLTNVTCTSIPAPFVFTAGNGGAGGWSGVGQGTDQGEDQGENIGRMATGSPVNGPTVVDATNELVAGNAPGGNGASIAVRIENYIDGTCTPTSLGAAKITLTAGKGGVGGLSGDGQGTDQGEDQGENIGQFSSGAAGVGSVSVTATNDSTSAAANGGNGGDVRVAFNDFGTCDVSLEPKAAADERVLGAAGAGGAAGSSGHLQGEDQGEDQGENIAQYASGGAAIGDISVDAGNHVIAGTTNGGHGGDVVATFAPDSCGQSDPRTERVDGAAGNGGKGGETGFEQGLDQGEDQGENIAQFAGATATFGTITVNAHNSAISGDAVGGNGGSVTVGDPTADCTDPTPSADPRVNATPGAGGAGGSSGFAQGSDQGEDQGENIGQYSVTSTGSPSVTADNNLVVGNVAGGSSGGITNGGCTIVPIVPLKPVRLRAVEPVEPEATACNGSFTGTATSITVSTGAVCILEPGAVVEDIVDVLPGGSLIDNGATIGVDLRAVRAEYISINGGHVGNNVSIDQLAGGGGANRICGLTAGGDIAIRASLEGSGIVDVGGSAPCSPNHAGHDLTVAANADGASTCFNGAAHLVTYYPPSTAFCRPRPGVLSESPAPGATGVARNVAPSITFDQAVTGVSSSTIVLRDVASAAVVSATVTYDAASHRATLHPAALLGTGRLYRVEVADTITADRPFWGTSWTFRVTTDGTAPTFTRTPAVNATGVSRLANVVLRFSEPVIGVSATTVRLRDTVTGHYVPAVVAYNATLRLATLNPSVTLAANRRYQVVVATGITDRAGNPLHATSWFFRTGF